MASAITQRMEMAMSVCKQMLFSTMCSTFSSNNLAEFQFDSFHARKSTLGMASKSVLGKTVDPVFKEPMLNTETLEY